MFPITVSGLGLGIVSRKAYVFDCGCVADDKYPSPCIVKREAWHSYRELHSWHHIPRLEDWRLGHYLQLNVKVTQSDTEKNISSTGSMRGARRCAWQDALGARGLAHKVPGHVLVR